MDSIENKYPDKISVIMGIYNCADTLPEAFMSIVNQTHTNWEMILCDDASTDDTYKIADEFRQKYPDRVVLLHNDTNKRLAFSLNRCLEYATGEYIARMDGDDKCVPERFEKQLQYLKENPQYDVVGTAMRRFSDAGLADIVYGVENPDYYTMMKSAPFNHATILMKKSAYDLLEGYTATELTSRCEDQDLWFRFYSKGLNGNNLKEPLYLVRENEKAIKRRTFKYRIYAIKVINKGYKLLGYPRLKFYIRASKIFLKGLVPSSIQMGWRKIQKSIKNSH